MHSRIDDDVLHFQELSHLGGLEAVGVKPLLSVQVFSNISTESNFHRKTSFHLFKFPDLFHRYRFVEDATAGWGVGKCKCSQEHYENLSLPHSKFSIFLRPASKKNIFFKNNFKKANKQKYFQIREKKRVDFRT